MESRSLRDGEPVTGTTKDFPLNYIEEILSKGRSKGSQEYNSLKTKPAKRVYAKKIQDYLNNKDYTTLEVDYHIIVRTLEDPKDYYYGTGMSKADKEDVKVKVNQTLALLRSKLATETDENEKQRYRTEIQLLCPSGGCRDPGSNPEKCQKKKFSSPNQNR